MKKTVLEVRHKDKKSEIEYTIKTTPSRGGLLCPIRARYQQRLKALVFTLFKPK